MSSTQVTIGKRQLSLSNLDKVLYPETGFTKSQVLDFYARIAPVLLPHLEDRPLTLKRYPNGVTGHHFYEKRSPSHRPDWVKTFLVPKSSEPDIPFTLVNDLPTLIWIANLASIELHPSLSKIPTLERPTMVVFDLDPGAPAGAVECCAVAVRIRALLDRLGLESWVKTSGSKGIQVYAPLNTPTTYDQTKPFAKAVAELLEQETPKLVVSQMAKALRVGKVLVDWSQNDEVKTTVSVYSLRARERPMVSAPIAWDELEAALKKQDASTLFFDAEQTLARVEKLGDLFAPLLKKKQKLPDLTSAGPGSGRKRGGAGVGRRR